MRACLVFFACNLQKMFKLFVFRNLPLNFIQTCMNDIALAWLIRCESTIVHKKSENTWAKVRPSIVVVDQRFDKGPPKRAPVISVDPVWRGDSRRVTAFMEITGSSPNWRPSCCRCSAKAAGEALSLIV